MTARTFTNVVGFDDAPFHAVRRESVSKIPRPPGEDAREAHRLKSPLGRGIPFERRGDIMLVGAVCARTRLDGVVTDRIRRDGVNSTDGMVRALERSQFASQVRLVFLQGIAVGGFNVVDIDRLHATLGVPVLVVARRSPKLESLRQALLGIPGGAAKWRLIERAGPMEPVSGVFVQRRGLSLDEAERTLRATTLHGKLPEALRVAHLIAGGVTTGASRGRA